MNESKRPTHRIFAKLKGSGKDAERIKVAACWQSQHGLNVRLEDHWKLVSPRGQVITSEEFWLNVYEERQGRDDVRSNDASTYSKHSDDGFDERKHF